MGRNFGICPLLTTNGVGQSCQGTYCEFAIKDKEGRFVNCAIVEIATNLKNQNKYTNKTKEN